MWFPGSNFQRNMIPINIKQYQRCSMFCSAMKATADLLSDMIKREDKDISIFINKILKTATKARVPCPPLMGLFKTSIPGNKHFVKQNS